MRCCCCNKTLNDYESTLKGALSGDYLDMCMTCLDGLGIETIGREDLSTFEEVEEDDIVDNDMDEYYGI